MVDDDRNKRNRPPSQTSFRQAPRVHPDFIDAKSAQSPEQNTAPVENTEATETVKVADGRTVHVPLPGQRSQIGFDSLTGSPIFRTQCRIYQAGEMLELPISEAQRLRECGFLFDPNRVVAPATTFDAQSNKDMAVPGVVSSTTNGTGR